MLVTDYNIQDIAMNLIIQGYATPDNAIEYALAIDAGMKIVNNINEAAAKESDKCEVYSTRRKMISYISMGSLTCRRKYETVITDSSSIRAERLLKLKDVEWKMMTDITGLNEFQILSVV